MLGNSPRQQTVIALEAAKSFAFGLRFVRTETEAAVDLTGATVRLVAKQPPRKGGAVLFTKTATAVDAVNGVMQFELQATDLAVAAAEYPFDVTLVSSNGYSSPVMKGVLDVRDNADTTSTNTYTGINPSTSLAVYVDQGDVVQVNVDKIDGMYAVVQTMIADTQASLDAKVTAAQGHATNAQTSATNAANSASTATTQANRAQAEADRAAGIASGATDPVVAELVSNPTSSTNNAIETLIGGTPPAAHIHDDRYYTEAEVDALIAPLPTTGHIHDDRYYTELEIDTKLGEITGGAVVQAAEPVLDEGEFWWDTDDDLPAGLDGTGFRMERSGKDANKIFTIIEYFRTDGTKALRSELSGGASPTYTTRTVTEYAADGITAVLTTIYTLTYDGDGDLVSEVFA